MISIILFTAVVIATSIALNYFSRFTGRIIAEAGTALVICSAYLFFMRRTALKELPIYPSIARIITLVLGIIAGGGLLAVVVSVNDASGFIDIHPALPPLHMLKNAYPIVLVSLFAAIWEEVAFRGFILQRSSELIGVHASCVIIALFFGALHLFSPLSGYQIVISTVFSGLLLNYSYFLSKGLYFPIGIHFGWNCLNGLLSSGKFMRVDVINSLYAGITNIEQGLVAIFFTALAAVMVFVCYTRLPWHH